MWTVIKFDRKEFEFLKKDFEKFFGKDIKIYVPKLFFQRYKKNRIVIKEFNLLGDYLFCFHDKFKNPQIINSLKFTRGLKYFLDGFIEFQLDVKNFIEKCKNLEDSKGYISQNLFEINVNSNYEFSSGPFAGKIFKIINFQKNKINTCTRIVHNMSEFPI